MRSDTGPVRLTSPSAVIASVPYLLGFIPEASMVVVLISAAGGDSAAIRLDLPDAREPASGAPDAPAGRLPATCRVPPQVLQHVGEGACGAVLAFGTQPVGAGPVPYAELISSCARTLVEHGITVLVRAYVHDGRWWDAGDEDGHSGAVDDTSHERRGSDDGRAGRLVLDEDGIAAAFAFADRGERFAPSRAALEARYPPCDPTRPPPEGHAALQAALARSRSAGSRAWSSRRADLEGSVRAAICDHQACVCPRQECTSRPAASDAALRVALAEATVREPILHTLCLAADRTAGRRATQVAIRSLESRVRSAHDCAAAPIFAVLAVLHWHTGNGTLAAISAEHALIRQPQNTLASLVAQAVRQGLPPEHWTQILRRFTLADLRRGNPPAASAPTPRVAPSRSVVLTVGESGARRGSPSGTGPDQGGIACQGDGHAALEKSGQEVDPDAVSEATVEQA